MNKRPAYTVAEIEGALEILAAERGNASRAAKEIRERRLLDGRAPQRQTLARWRRERPEAYASARAKAQVGTNIELSEGHDDLALREAALVGRLLGEIERLIAEGEYAKASQVANILGKLDIGSGIHTQRSREVRGEPNVVVERLPSLKELIDSMRARGVVISGIVDGEAEEITDALTPGEEEEGEEPAGDE